MQEAGSHLLRAPNACVRAGGAAGTPALILPPSSSAPPAQLAAPAQLEHPYVTCMHAGGVAGGAGALRARAVRHRARPQPARAVEAGPGARARLQAHVCGGFSWGARVCGCVFTLGPGGGEVHGWVSCVCVCVCVHACGFVVCVWWVRWVGLWWGLGAGGWGWSRGWPGSQAHVPPLMRPTLACACMRAQAFAATQAALVQASADLWTGLARQFEGTA
jgi:hypothetical protein